MEIYKSFNTPLEIGTRAAFILSGLQLALSIDELVILDYALLYSKEFSGPDNLHPALPNHIAEIAHRREVMPEAVNYFVRKGLITLELNEKGYYYLSNNNTEDFIACLQSSYFKKIWFRLNWMTENHSAIVNTNILELKKSAR